VPKCVLALCDRDSWFGFTRNKNLQTIILFSLNGKVQFKTQAGQTLEVQTYLEASTTNGPHSAFAWSN